MDARTMAYKLIEYLTTFGDNDLSVFDKETGKEYEILTEFPTCIKIGDQETEFQILVKEKKDASRV